MVDIRRQYFIIARLADYCDYQRGNYMLGDDPVSYLWNKLKEIEEPLHLLKQEILETTVRIFMAKAKSEKIENNDLVEFRHLMDRFLSIGDFADASFHLNLDSLQDPKGRAWAEEFLSGLKAHTLLEEEFKPVSKRNKIWEQLVLDMYKRLEFDLLDQVLKHKPLSRRRLAFILYRCRRNTKDYCSVFHVPLHQDDTFTPFILPRVEALVAANQRFLRKLRKP